MKKMLLLFLLALQISFYSFSQNVGIGTTTPAFKLDVRSGSINTDSVYRIGTYPVLSIKGQGSFFAGTNAGINTTSGTLNTAIGDSALFSNTSGYANLATGSFALFSNTTGYGNVANGYAALGENTTGSQNVATGVSALSYNTTGAQNVANGYNTLLRNVTGDQNVAIGTIALSLNTTGSRNVANGYAALTNNTTGVDNVATGTRALSKNTTGYENTADGTSALYANTTGNGNVGLGDLSLSKNTTGSDNIGLGGSSLPFVTTGSANIGIGGGSGASTGNLNYTVAIGAAAKVDCSNCLVLGGTGYYRTNVGLNNPSPFTDLHIIQQSDNGGDKLRGIRLQRAFNTNHWRTLIDPSNNYVFEYNDGLYTYINPTTGAYINPSDVRLEKDITPLENMLDQVMALVPKKFHYKTNSADDPLLWGFIAQDVRKIFPDFVDVKDDGYLGISYTNFSVVAIKAIQEQQDEIKELKQQNESQQKQIDTFQKQNDLQQTKYEELKNEIEVLKAKIIK